MSRRYICAYVYVYSNCEYVTLTGDDVKEGDIRLVAGSYLWQGFVEIFLDGIWGRIDYDGVAFSYPIRGTIGATSSDARVVCRQLGYNTYGKILTIGDY